jgi:TusA-related sulfurtransferase
MFVPLKCANGEEETMATGRLCDRFLDITEEICPFTFVKTKLLLEEMAVGEVAEIRLNSGEPLVNVPRSAAEAGHAVLSVEPEDPAETRWRIRIERR